MVEKYIKKCIKFDSKNIVYFVKGNSRQAVFYCHGDGQNHTSGKIYLELFPNNYKKISIDLPGHGYSSDLEKRTLNIEANLIYNIICKEKIESLFIIGHSHGASIGVAYATKHPVKGLILFDPLLDNPKKLFGNEKIKNLEQTYLSMIKGKFDSNAPYNFYGNEKNEEEIMRAAITTTPYETMAKNLSVYQNCDFEKDIKKFDFPVLILQSENPPIPQFKDMNIKKTKDMPKGKIELIIGGTHNMHILMKEIVSKKIIENFHFLCV